MQGDNISYLASASTFPKQKGSPRIGSFGMQGDNIIYLTSASTLPQKGSPLIRIFGEKGGNLPPYFPLPPFQKRKAHLL